MRASLAVELRTAARALAGLADGTALPAALDAAMAEHEGSAGAAPLAPASRAAIRDMASRTVRRWGTCQALSALLNQRAPAPELLFLQQVALAQLLAPVRADATTVDQTVAAVRADPAHARAAGFMNATLRRFLREREALLAAVQDDPVARWNFPAWWLRELRSAWPDHWQAIVEHSDQPPPLTVRVNIARITPEAWLARLADAGLAGTRIGPQAVRLASPRPVEALPGWAEGLVSVQDAGAQLAAVLLDAHNGMRVLDACAAPGGKTTHVLELAAVDLLALDVDSARLARVRENLERLGQRAQLAAGDAAHPGDWHDGQPFDRILLDAPCSASGIVRRQPDVRWRRRRRDMATFSDQQLAMLRALWPLLARDGKFLYSTCSIFPAEGEQLVARFMGAVPDAERLPLAWAFPGQTSPEPVAQLLPTASEQRDHDGFFYAMFGKRN